jgi:hypothetical protein
MKSVVATDSSNNFFVGWTLAGPTKKLLEESVATTDFIKVEI